MRELFCWKLVVLHSTIPDGRVGIQLREIDEKGEREREGDIIALDSGLTLPEQS